jgi:hypothetical protein
MPLVCDAPTFTTAAVADPCLNDRCHRHTLALPPAVCSPLVAPRSATALCCRLLLLLQACQLRPLLRAHLLLLLLCWCRPGPTHPPKHAPNEHSPQRQHHAAPKCRQRCPAPDTRTLWPRHHQHAPQRLHC